MNTILATILILGASGSVQRTIESPHSIAGTVVRLAVGLVARKAGKGLADAASGITTVGNCVTAARNSTTDIDNRLRSVGAELRIDGREVSGISGWFAAAGRVARYVSDISARGAVQWSGGRTVRGRWVRWSVTVEDNMLTISGDAFNVQRLDYVRFVLRADEYAGRTRITGVADGRTALGSRCGLVRRVVERAIREGLAGPLAKLEAGGRELYAGGDPAVLIEAFVSHLGR